MHYHCEIIMPPAADISEQIEQILSKFNENTEDPSGNEFWDWYVIGGRWSGKKELCGYSQEKLDLFHNVLKEKKVTVSGIQCGKQQLEPKSQIPMVDKIWSEHFPTENGEIVPCPLFTHSNDQYDSNDLLSCDICRVDEIPEDLICNRVIIAAPGRGCSESDSKIEAVYMICEDQWNGVNHMNIDWDHKVKSALETFLSGLTNYRNRYKEKVTPRPDWICVTVDYHN
jgi:hypothetical protein